MTNEEKALIRKIQSTSFALLEANLYLDTHPNCNAAMDFYNKKAKELDMYTKEYEKNYNPLIAMKPSGGDVREWSWATSPWPWQTEE